MITLVVHGSYSDVPISEQHNLMLKTDVDSIKVNDIHDIHILVPSIIVKMEQSGRYNAGLGSVKRNNNYQLLDGCFAISEPLRFAGVAGVSIKESPVLKAIHKALDTQHPLVYNNYHNYHNNDKYNMNKKNITKSKYDTIGAMATNGKRIVLAGSTGGITDADQGRISDTAVFGSGYYINKSFGILASGEGDAFIRANACLRAAIYYESTNYTDADTALEHALSYVIKYGKGSLMLLTLDGKFYHKETPNGYINLVVKKMNI